MRSKIILMLVIFSLIIGCVDTNKNNLSPDEQKLVGTWTSGGYDADTVLKFNDDRTVILDFTTKSSSSVMKSFYHYTINNNEIVLTDTDGKKEIFNYKFINSNTLQIDMYGIRKIFEKSRW